MPRAKKDELENSGEESQVQEEQSNTAINDPSKEVDANPAKDGLDAELEAAATKAVAPKQTEKLLKVKGLIDHNCFIGKVRYIIAAKRDYELPRDVAIILSQAGVVAVR